MEALTEVLNLVQTFIQAVGIAFVLLGGYHFFDGYRSENSADQAKGLKQAIAGAAIFALGLKVVPMLANGFSF